MPPEDPWSLVTEMQKDPALKQAIDAITVHYTEIDTKDVPHPVTVPQSVIDFGKPLWASEDHPARAIWRDPRENDWPRGSDLGKLYNENYIVRRYTKTEPWAVVTSYYDVLRAPNSGLMYAATPWSGHFRVQSTVWTTAHTTQFAQPGWSYIDQACAGLQGKGSYVTLKSPNGRDYSIVVETVEATAKQTVTFEVAGGLSQGVVHVWRTNERSLFERVADITPKNGTFSITLDPASIYSLTTTTGQRKGTAVSPRDTPFPLPYAEDFERTPVGQSPKYLSDQNGAFEAMPCTGRAGRCVEQVVEVAADRLERKLAPAQRGGQCRLDRLPGERGCAAGPPRQGRAGGPHRRDELFLEGRRVAGRIHLRSGPGRALANRNLRRRGRRQETGAR